MLTYAWGGAIKIGAITFWGRVVFVLVISHINIGYQKSLTPPLKQAVIFATLGTLDLAASVFFNVHIVSKSPAECSPPIGAFMELCSNANLPCMVNLALDIFCHFSSQINVS